MLRAALHHIPGDSSCMSIKQASVTQKAVGLGPYRHVREEQGKEKKDKQEEEEEEEEEEAIMKQPLSLKAQK
jgi:ribosomal protein L12E/L44/L45/RPP1/RPP2